MKYLGKRPLISPHSREAITLSNIHVSHTKPKEMISAMISARNQTQILQQRKRHIPSYGMASLVLGIPESNSSPNDIEYKRARFCVLPFYLDGYRLDFGTGLSF
jgi:hypothetical protein